MVDKAGIDEELVRLRSHLQAFGHALAEEERWAGSWIYSRKCFANQIQGAKSIDYQMTGLVVEMKPNWKNPGADTEHRVIKYEGYPLGHKIGEYRIR